MPMRRLGHDPLQLGGEQLDVVDAVMNEEDLPAAIQFAQHGVANQRFVEPGDARFDGQPIFRRRFEIRDVAQAQAATCASVRGIGVAVSVSTSIVCRSFLSRSFTSTPNRCSSSMITSPRLANATSACASRCVPMTISTEPVFRPAMMRLCCRRGAKAAERRDLERELGHPLGERAAMLLAENRGGHEHGHLIAGVDRFERRPHRHFGFAVADVAAEEPIHRAFDLHVVLDGGDGGELVGRFAIGKRGVEFVLPGGVGGIANAGPRRPHRLQLQHLDRQIGHGLLGRFLLLGPQPAADMRQRRLGFAAADVFLHQLDIDRRHVDFRAAVEFQLQMLFDLIVLFQQLQPAIAADAVRQVDDIIPFAQIQKAVDHAAELAAAGPGQIAAVKQLVAADQHDPLIDQAKAGLQMADGEMELAELGEPSAAENFLEPLALRPRSGRSESRLARRRRNRVRRALCRCRR